MKEKYQKAVFSRITVTVCAVLAAIIPLFFFSHRNNQHIFLEKDVFVGFSQVMFWLMIANALVSMIWAALVFKKRDVPEAHPLPFTIAFTVTYVLTIAALIFEIVQISVASIETRPAIQVERNRTLSSRSRHNDLRRAVHRAELTGRAF